MTAAQDICVPSAQDIRVVNLPVADLPECQNITLLDVVSYFKDLKDPRSEINRVYPLEAVIAMAVMGILAGANGPTAIAKWADTQRVWLSQALSLPDERTPSKDVFLNVLSLLHPTAFQDCFTNWLNSLKLKAMQKLEIDRPILSVDGKTLRRSHNKKKGLKALHSVSIWASELGLTLCQVACAEKSNEITAMPYALRLVDIAGTIITIDAMGCQKDLVKQIIDAKADYVIALKDNQPTLADAVETYFHEQLANQFAGCQAQFLNVTEKAHGKMETRQYTQMPVPADLPMLADWPGLKSIGMAVREYKLDGGGTTTDVRYYISSMSVDVGEFARAVRGHWGIENGCHNCLDVTFREDYSRIREERGRENFAFLNRVALSLLRQHEGKESFSLKRQTCGWNPSFLLEVLTGSTT